MSRRTLTSLLAFGLAALLVLAGFTVQVPYVLLSGGPTFNTIGEVDGVPVITITGRQTFEDTDGRLDLTTVNVDRSLTLWEAMQGWVRTDQAVVPRELLYPPGKTDDQVQAENAAQMVTSQSAAKTAALLELGIPVTVTVGEVSKDGPANGVLEAGDDLVSVDGTPVTSPQQLRELIGQVAPGDTVSVVVAEDGVERTEKLVTQASAEDPPRPLIGIVPAVTEYPFTIDISLENVGGPSAGMMFALGIIDKLTPGSLADGRYVAGTGELDDQGRVGPIGGIEQKLAEAGKKGVDVFLVPADNCSAAVKNAPEKVELVEVATLSQAYEALRTIAAGGTPAGC